MTTAPETQTAPAPKRVNVPPLYEIQRERCRRSFVYFLRFWHFKNRESGQVSSFRPVGEPCPTCKPTRTNPAPCVAVGLWSGQVQLAEAYQAHAWVFALKAGKLGFTELECAFDAWVGLFRQANARVNLFSKDDIAAKTLLTYVAFGLRKLPPTWGVQFQDGMAGGRTTKSLIVRHRWCQADDLRQFVSYPATGNAAIDASAQHSHVDELSHMLNGEALWNSVATTVAPGGSVHIVTRGAGDAVYSAELWRAAEATPTHLQGTAMHPYPYFAPFDARPDRTEAERQAMESSGALTQLGLAYYLPKTAEDALMGDDVSPYIPLEVWDRRKDESLVLPLPGDRTPLVLAVDAAVSKDSFAVVAASRHPARHDDIAIRAAKIWRPQDSGGQIDYLACERWLRFVCGGGCNAGHPRTLPYTTEAATRENANQPTPGCDLCNAGDFPVPGMNVVQICYDPHQMEDMAQRLRREHITWIKAYDQGRERLVGDSLMYSMALTGTLTHNGNPDLREHIGNAKAKLQVDQESTMRIVKKHPDRKIDAAVAAAMAVKRTRDLNL